jgi:hypothetical protein
VLEPRKYSASSERKAMKIISPLFAAALTSVLLVLPLLTPGAMALEKFDFECRYLMHEGQQIWDFCLTPDGDEFHVFYHTIPPQNQHPAYADTIWHAVSSDMRRWDFRGPAITSGPDWWDATAVWAPDVVYDEASGRWAMLYTGVSSNMVQRTCLAWSDDLDNWTKDAANPVFEPDTLAYHWHPDQDWSSFRDPFIFWENNQWNMLNTAHQRLGGYPGYKQAIVHRAVSDDLVNWTDAGVFFAHDGEAGTNWYDLESVQYYKRNGYHYLFFVEQDPDLEVHKTSLIYAHDRADWTFADRSFLDDGWAPEVQYVGGFWFDTMFGRLHQYDDPSTGLTNVVARFDLMTFGFLGWGPSVSNWDPLYSDWTRYGEVGEAAPTFGDNPVLRGETSARLEGHGWFSSFEHFGGPLSGEGSPGDTLGVAATGALRSKEFRLSGDYLTFLVAGGEDPENLFINLEDTQSGVELFRQTGNGAPFMTRRIWDLRPFQGRDVRLNIVDNNMGPDGWIAVDSIEETDRNLSPVGEDIPQPAHIARCYPNPFNPRTNISFGLGKPELVTVEVFDVSGRLVHTLASRVFPAGYHELSWNGQDSGGRSLPSGTYLVRLSGGKHTESHKVMLVK